MDKIKLRQICFYFACMMPAGKLLIYPATLTYYAKNDLLLSAALNLAAQAAVIGIVLLLAARTDRTFFELLASAFGQIAARIVFGVFAGYFLFSALLPMLEQRVFVTQVLYENVPSVLAYAPFFAVSLFACMKGFKTIGRTADIAMPLFAAAFVALILLAAPHADFGALLPVGTNGTGIFRGALYGLNWYTDCLYPLFFLGHFRPEKKTAGKVLLAFAAGAAAVLLFLAVFYGIFEDIAVLRQNSIAHISKYTTSFTSLGRVDFLFVFAVTLVNVFCLCIPLQLCVHCLKTAFPRVRPFLFAAAVNGALLLAVLLLSDSFLELQQFVTRNLWAVFLLFSYILPVAAHLLCRKRAKEANDV